MFVRNGVDCFACAETLSSACRRYNNVLLGNKKHSFLSYPILDSLVRITGDILLVVCIYTYFVPRLERSVWFAGKCTDGYFVYVKGGLLDSWTV